jgi:hypothetical protein
MTADDLAGIAAALGGAIRTPKGYDCRCPAHGDKTASLSIAWNGDRLLVKCWAGCDWREIMDALRARGLLPNGGRRPSRRHDLRQWTTPSASNPAHETIARSESARLIWNASRAAADTPVDCYLRSRSITIPTPRSIHFRPNLKHTPSGRHFPGMVAIVTNVDDEPTEGIHRTFLAQDGRGKAPVEPNKMMLGSLSGGSVHLAEPVSVEGDANATFLMVGEGIETTLSAMQLFRRPAWAALSTSGLTGLILPDNVSDVVVLADADESGETAAREAAAKWKQEGRRVRIMRPADGCNDFNDQLVARQASVQEPANA